MNQDDLFNEFCDRFAKILGTDELVGEFLEEMMNSEDVSDFVQSYPNHTDDEMNEFLNEYLESLCDDPESLKDEYSMFIDENI